MSDTGLAHVGCTEYSAGSHFVSAGGLYDRLGGGGNGYEAGLYGGGDVEYRST